MNIAFPALLIALFILPGLFFTLSFYNTDNKQLNYIPLTHKTALSLFVTFLLHVFGLFTLDLFAKYPIDLSKFLILISGDHSELFTSTLKTIGNTEIINTTIYLTIIYFLAFLIGKMFRFLIKKFKLDKYTKLLRINSPWFYLFTGYDWEDGKPDGVIISACTEFGGKTYLYQGYLERFFLTEDGNIDRLILTDAERRLIENDKMGPEKSDKNLRFYPIDGHYFVLKYAEIKNLNVQFFKLNLKKKL